MQDVKLPLSSWLPTWSLRKVKMHLLCYESRSPLSDCSLMLPRFGYVIRPLAGWTRKVILPAICSPHSSLDPNSYHSGLHHPILRLLIGYSKFYFYFMWNRFRWLVSWLLVDHYARCQLLHNLLPTLCSPESTRLWASRERSSDLWSKSARFKRFKFTWFMSIVYSNRLHSIGRLCLAARLAV